MKKILVMAMVMMLVCSGAVLAAEGYFNAKLGYDFGGDMDMSSKVEFSDGSNSNVVESESDVDGGVSVSFEYLVPVSNKIEWGVGLNYQFNRNLEGASKGFNYIPIYGIAKYNLDSIYLLGNVGYSMFNFERDLNDQEDLKGGLYYGVGAGLDISENLTAELMYSVSNGKYEYTDINDDKLISNYEYSKISLALGYAF